MAGYSNIQRSRRGRHVMSEPAHRFNSIAEALDWSPLGRGGPPFASHVLKQADADTLVFTPSLWVQLFRWSFVPVGLLVAFGVPEAYGLLAQLEELPLGLSKGQMNVVVGALFMSVSYVLGGAINNPRRFDRSQGRFTNVVGGKAETDSLKGLAALQLISLKEGSYELNLVYGDGRRTNVIDHGDLRQIRRDARLLGRFLGVPLWEKMG